MKRHSFDPFSMIFGLLFAISGLVFLMNDIDANDLDPVVGVLVTLVVVGLLLAAIGLKRATARREELGSDAGGSLPGGAGTESHESTSA